VLLLRFQIEGLLAVDHPIELPEWGKVDRKSPRLGRKGQTLPSGGGLKNPSGASADPHDS